MHLLPNILRKRFFHLKEVQKGVFVARKAQFEQERGPSSSHVMAPWSGCLPDRGSPRNPEHCRRLPSASWPVQLHGHTWDAQQGKRYGVNLSFVSVARMQSI